MREHRYRGKRIDNGEWVYGSLVLTPDAIENFNAVIIPDDNRMYSDDKNLGFETWYKVDPEIAGEYTGLHDKNGKEIYEFDCCEVYRDCVYAKGFIKFHQGCFIFKEFGTGNILRLCDLQINGYKIKVTGTVFDNPELLQEAGK